MSLPDTFDVNSVGSDSHLQFTNWTIDNNGAWDYAADTRGYTVGGVLEYDDRGVVGALRHCRHAHGRQRHHSRLGVQPRQRAELGVRTAQGAVRAAAESETRGRGARVELCEPRAHGRLPRVGAAVSRRQDRHARHHADRTLWRGEVRLRPEHRAGSDRQPAAVLRASAGTRISTSRSLTPRWARRFSSAAITAARAGIGRTTRWAWRLFRTPSSATTRIIFTTADWAFCWATAT